MRDREIQGQRQNVKGSDRGQMNTGVETEPETDRYRVRQEDRQIQGQKQRVWYTVQSARKTVTETQTDSRTTKEPEIEG